jgi:hypothetical protein
VVGVHASEDAGAAPAPEQKLLATVWPSDCKQVTARVVVAEPTSATHDPVRVCAKLVPQPAAGLQEEYCQLPVPPAQAA